MLPAGLWHFTFPTKAVVWFAGQCVASRVGPRKHQRFGCCPWCSECGTARSASTSLLVCPAHRFLSMLPVVLLRTLLLLAVVSPYFCVTQISWTCCCVYWEVAPVFMLLLCVSVCTLPLLPSLCAAASPLSSDAPEPCRCFSSWSFWSFSFFFWTPPCVSSGRLQLSPAPTA